MDVLTSLLTDKYIATQSILVFEKFITTTVTGQLNQCSFWLSFHSLKFMLTFMENRPRCAHHNLSVTSSLTTAPKHAVLIPSSSTPPTDKQWLTDAPCAMFITVYNLPFLNIEFLPFISPSLHITHYSPHNILMLFYNDYSPQLEQYILISIF